MKPTTPCVTDAAPDLVPGPDQDVLPPIQPTPSGNVKPTMADAHALQVGWLRKDIADLRHEREALITQRDALQAYAMGLREALGEDLVEARDFSLPWPISCHEAGHAVIASVRLGAGSVMYVAAEWDRGGTTYFQDHDDPVIVLAGLAAEAMDESETPSGALSRLIESERCDGRYTPASDVFRLDQDFAGIDDDLIDETLGLVAKHWTRIEKVAEELARFGYVDGCRLDDIVRFTDEVAA